MIYKPAFGYEGLYLISINGEIVSLPKSTSKKSFIMKTTSINNSGYINIPLCKNGVRKTHTLHSIVARAFIGERPLGCDIDHINGDKTDNRSINLRYITRKENMRNAVRNGFNNRGVNSKFAKLDNKKIISIRSETGKLSYLSSKYGVTMATISRIKSRKIWSHVI